VSAIRERHLAVARTARYAALGPVGAPDVWFALHGYGQLARRFLTAFTPIAAPGRLIVAPEALNRFYVDEAHQKVGATWMTREDRLTDIDDYVRYLDAVADEVLAGADRRVTVLGFSQGSATACRWLTRGRVRAARLILWGGEVPPDLDVPEAAARLRGVDVVLVAGKDDHFITPKVLRAAAARLTALGVAHRAITFDGGHAIDGELLWQIADGR
jgi:predicted esterase